MVCGAATSRSSGGRSAVHTSSGTSAWLRLHDGGVQLDGGRAARAQQHRRPAGGQAQTERQEGAERSSWWTWSRSRGSAARARASGVEREPGATTASVTPARTHSSTSVAQKVAAMLTCLSWPRAPPHRATRRRSAAPRAGARLHPDRSLVVGRSPTTSPRDHEVVLVDAPGHGGSSQACGDLPAGRARPRPRRAATRSTSGTRWAGASACSWPWTSPSGSHGLVLLGATAGIVDDGERAARRAADEALAADLERDGLEVFLERWLALPLFAGLSADAAGVDDRRRNTAAGLASSLRLAGTGAQADCGAASGELDDAGARAGRRARRQVRRPRPCAGRRRSARTPGSRRSPGPATPPTWSGPRRSSSAPPLAHRTGLVRPLTRTPRRSAGRRRPSRIWRGTDSVQSARRARAG